MSIVAMMKQADMVDPTEAIDVMNEDDEEVADPQQFGPDEVANLSLGGTDPDLTIPLDPSWTSAEVAMLQRRGYEVVAQEPNTSGFKGYLKGVQKALDKFDPPQAKEMQRYVERLMAKL